MNKFILGVLILVGICVFFMTCKSSLEPFINMKMTPWFGYEPGYGPGFGRKGCCNTATAESISANNL
jgi:hypothetical protein